MSDTSDTSDIFHLKTYRETTMRYRVVLESSEEGFAVSVPGVPGCHSQGKTEQEALQNISDALSEYFEVVKELTQNSMVKEIEVGA